MNSNFTILYLLLCSKVAEASVTLQITVQWISRQLQVPVFGIVHSCFEAECTLGVAISIKAADKAASFAIECK